MKEGYPLRLPDGMRDRIKEEAERNCRSMNAEIVFHLQRALFDPLGPRDPAGASRMERA
ncbi:Arc family DNA-binding protein [Rhizobium sp. TRM95111]|uniref:Arc family DNA-binding protein n=1 Tax=Rhizobium alarense TaxID=2846851 RepID=UPI001F470505|nr:Arc family DNA-binding protein [Rhizobium alarense]MCF3642910.1 Arc family DNA-binding protein [Rhizobium alarense]